MHKEKSRLFKIIAIHLIYGILFAIWYKTLLFRCLPQFSVFESVAILICLIVIGIVLGCIIDYRKQQYCVHPCLNLSIGFGIYTFLSYSTIETDLLLIAVIVTCLFSIVYAFGIILFRRNRIMSTETEILNRLVFKALSGSKNILSLGLAVIMFITVIVVIIDSVNYDSSVTVVEFSEQYEYDVSNSIEEMTRLNSKCEPLTFDERLEFCQYATDYCCYDYGITYRLNIGWADLPDNTLAYYSDDQHLIVISKSVLESPSTSNTQLIKICSHECTHALQYALIQAYNNSPEELRNLYIYREAILCAEDFSSYIDDDFSSYSNQYCEQMARAFSEYETSIITERINNNTFSN